MSIAFVFKEPRHTLDTGHGYIASPGNAGRLSNLCIQLQPIAIQLVFNVSPLTGYSNSRDKTTTTTTKILNIYCQNENRNGNAKSSLSNGD